MNRNERIFLNETIKHLLNDKNVISFEINWKKLPLHKKHNLIKPVIKVKIKR